MGPRRPTLPAAIFGAAFVLAAALSLAAGLLVTASVFLAERGAPEGFLGLHPGVSSVFAALVRRWSEQGDGYLVGGTEAGRCIGCVREELGAFFRLAWRVVDYLEAHDQLARRVGGVPGPKR